MYDQKNNRGPGGNRYNQNGQGDRKQQKEHRQNIPPKPIEAATLPEDYLEQAENLMRDSYREITTSKIRRLYSLVTEVYNVERLRTEKELSTDSIPAIGLMRVRIAYECGRDKKVKGFVQQAKILEYLKGLGNQRENFIRFSRYMEALVAYHKFFGGKEN